MQDSQDQHLVLAFRQKTLSGCLFGSGVEGGDLPLNQIPEIQDPDFGFRVSGRPVGSQDGLAG